MLVEISLLEIFKPQVPPIDSFQLLITTTFKKLKQNGRNFGMKIGVCPKLNHNLVKIKYIALDNFLIHLVTSIWAMLEFIPSVMS